MSSYGLCCYKKEENKEPMILVLRRRYTYSFCSLMYNTYRTLDDLKKIIDGTSIDEKIIISSFDYARIWDKVWTGSRPDKFFKYKQLFETMVEHVGQAELRNILDNAKSQDVIWELPKGRKDAYPESDIECACREFIEESNIPRESFRVHMDINSRCHFRDGEMAFVMKFWAATLKDNNASPKCSLSDKSHHEHDLIRFVPISRSKEYLSGPMHDVMMNNYRAWHKEYKTKK